MRHQNGVRLADKEHTSQIMSDFNLRSREILQENFVESKYEEFAKSMVENYLWAFSGTSRTFLYKVFDKITAHGITKRILKKRYSRNKKLILQNFVECEAHRELIIKGLKYF